MLRRNFLIAAFTTLSLAAGILPAAAEDYPSMTLKMAHVVPPAFPGAPVDQWFADQVQKRSGGKIKIQIFWAGSMGKPTELLDLVSSGAVDMAAVPAGYFPSKLPLTGMTNSVMMLFDDNKLAVEVTEELVQKNQGIRDELKRNNIYPIFFHGIGTYRPFCNKPVATMADFKGLKVRSWGEYVPVLWQSLGATGVDVLPAEIYESLQRGTINCAFWPYDAVYSNKLYEVGKYASDLSFGAIPTWPVWVNWNTFFNVWPPQVRKLLLEVGKDARDRDIAETRMADSNAIKAMTEKHGVKLVHFTQMDQLHTKLPDFIDFWVSKMDAKGLGPQAKEIGNYIRQRTAGK